MSEKERVLVYPYGIQFSPILRHEELLQYKVASVVAPPGWGIKGDAGKADRGTETGYQVSGNFEIMLMDSDTVLIAKPEIPLDFSKVVKPKIDMAINAGKNIICTIGLKPQIREEIADSCAEHNVRFEYYGYGKMPEHPKSPLFDERDEGLYEIAAPVIYILGISERTNKFEVQLSLREKFIKNGYRVSQIGSRSYCELTGFHSFPEFMFDPSICEADKVILFNRLVKKVEIEEKPDVIIVGVPGAVMPFNHMLTNKFGILPYEVCKAVTPDVAVLCTAFEERKPEYFEIMSNSLKYKLGVEIGCFNMANTKVDTEMSKQERKMIYLPLDSGFIDQRIEDFKKSGYAVYNILNSVDCEGMFNCLVDKLSGNDAVEAI